MSPKIDLQATPVVVEASEVLFLPKHRRQLDGNFIDPPRRKETHDVFPPQEVPKQSLNVLQSTSEVNEPETGSVTVRMNA